MESTAVALPYTFRPNHSFPGLMACAHSSIEAPEDDEFVRGAAETTESRSSYNLSLTSSGLVFVGAQALTIVACLLPDKGSFRVIRRSLMSFGSPESLLTRCDDGESYFSFMPLFFLASTLEVSVTSTNFF